MIELKKEMIDKVLAYMEDHIADCLYLYGNIVRYGVDSPDVRVWYSEKDGKITSVIMKYFTGGHVFSRDMDFDKEELTEQFLAIAPDRLSGQKEIIDMLYEQVSDRYRVSYGGVFQLLSYRKMKSDRVKIERATEADVKGITDLLMSHESFSNAYTYDKMAEELYDRIHRGIGRSYIIRDGDRIVAHDGVTLEMDTYAVEGLALVHDDFRSTLYGSFIDSFMINDLAAEGKDLYCRIVEGRRMEAFEKMGNKLRGTYGKLTRIR